ncbi:hypothetical protein PV325_000064 [Microctonus aethiopoides]|nr:hypothetical protein PV325_000064 [Microctonus aethiopoides]
MNFAILIAIIGVLCGVSAQENAQRKLSNALLECYNTTEILLKDNHLPHNMHAFIAILRKIEDNPELQMDLRQLSVALLHRFRQSGISESPSIVNTPGITPYAPNEFPFFVHSRTLKLIPGDVRYFPNSSISLIERCTLHSMISNSIDPKERGDESVTCRFKSNEYRFARSLQTANVTGSSKHINADVETLTPEELDSIKNKNNPQLNDSSFDPNWFYPALPPNHPKNAQIVSFPVSRCPLESGVINTEWKTVSGGPLIAGIAAALQPQYVKISDLLLKKDWQPSESLSSMTLDNKWFATIAGDLAEVAILQGPQRDQYRIGEEGHWNSSVMPKSYFIDGNQDTEFTAAEIRGDLDGLILASEVDSWYKQVPTLKLSQIFDMYYSDRGVFNTSIRACNRRGLLTAVALNETTSAQAYSASVVLNEKLSKYYIAPETLKRFAVQATNDFFAFVPSMNNEPMCDYVDSRKRFDRLATDLTIVIDTNWQFSTIQSILAILLENYFYNFNVTQYSSYRPGFDLTTALAKLEPMQMQKLNRERELKIGGQRSDILLFVPFTGPSMSDSDKQYCKDRINKMSEDIPDAVILFLVSGSNNWGDFTRDSQNDVVSIGGGSIREARGPIMTLINRMKRVPRRLINSQCGANYEQTGTSAQYTNYLEPSGINFYRLHPNYFYTNDDDDALEIKIHPSTGGSFTICESRNPLHVNITDASITCTKIDRAETHTVRVSCADASFIGDCNPLYLSIAVNATSTTINRCTDSKYCRYPDAFKYTISYGDNMKCTNSTSSIMASLNIIYDWELNLFPNLTLKVLSSCYINHSVI